MSHVKDLNIELFDLECLDLAAKRCGCQLVQKPTFKWFGTHVGDYPVPEGFTKEDMGRCEYAIGLSNNVRAYEIGVVRSRKTPGAWTLMYDFWQGGYGIEAAVGGGDCQKLLQYYGVEVAKKELRQEVGIKGWEIIEEVTPDGYIEVKAIEKATAGTGW